MQMGSKLRRLLRKNGNVITVGGSVVILGRCIIPRNVQVGSISPATVIAIIQMRKLPSIYRPFKSESIIPADRPLPGIFEITAFSCFSAGRPIDNQSASSQVTLRRLTRGNQVIRLPQVPPGGLELD